MSYLSVSPESASLPVHSNFIEPVLTVASDLGLIKSAGKGE